MMWLWANTENKPPESTWIRKCPVPGTTHTESSAEANRVPPPANTKKIRIRFKTHLCSLNFCYCPDCLMHSEDIHQVVRVLRKEIRQWPVPAIGHYVETPFTVLISCILSLRTQDKTTSAASDRLFAIANNPRKMLATRVDVIRNA